MVPPGFQNYFYTVNNQRVFIDPNSDAAHSNELLHGGLRLMQLKVERSNIIRNIVQFD